MVLPVIRVSIGKYNIFHRSDEAMLFIVVKACQENNVLFRTLKEFIFLVIKYIVLVSLALTVTSTGLWHKLTSNWNLFKAKPKTGFSFNVQKCPVPALKVPPWQRSPTWTLKLKVIRQAGSQLGCTTSDSKKGSHGGQHSWCVTAYNFITIILIHFAGCYTPNTFRSVEKHCFW